MMMVRMGLVIIMVMMMMVVMVMRMVSFGFFLLNRNIVLFHFCFRVVDQIERMFQNRSNNVKAFLFLIKCQTFFFG